MGKFPKPTPEDYQRARKDANRPPVFRGSDFAMRFEQGRWSEDRLIEAINQTADFRAIPYGRSQVGPEDSSKIKEYWQEYAAAEAHGKRPDLLVLRASDYEWALQLLGDDPTTVPEVEFAPVVQKAICGIEAENSLWIGRQMKDYNTKVPLTKKDPKSPNIWVKDQDLPGLRVWMYHHQKPVVVVQVFYDVAYAIELLDLITKVDTIEAAPATDRDALQKGLGVFVREQSYSDSRTGIATKKIVYVAHHSVTTLFGELQGEVEAEAKVLFEPGGKIMSYVSFEGGTLKVTPEGIALLHGMGGYH